VTRTADNCVLEGAVPSRWIDLVHRILRQNSGIESQNLNYAHSTSTSYCLGFGGL
jgi:hypothetical protein